MIAEQSKRKVTAILIADVRGYSRLLGEDESWAVQTLGAYKEVMIAHIQEHRGRFVEAVGDNLLADFASAVDAVQCAVEIQQELKIRNRQFPEKRRMEFRIGVSLGDVFEEGDKIFGEAVNVAAKMESLAAAGGLCISGAAYNYVKKKLVLRYEYLGKQNVKNMEKPVRVYRVLIETKGFISSLGIWKRAVVRQWERLNPLVKVIVALVVVANGVWQIYPSLTGSSFQIFLKGKWAAISPDKSSRGGWSDASEMASKEKMAFPLPDVPSVAVLPFANMSEDPKQEALSDGITEYIITALSKVPRMFVIARNSTFTYKGKPVKVKRVSEELGVRYVLEGSVQRSGDHIRINAQLIDALTGHHLWGEHYDRKLNDVFAVQDEVTLKIVKAMQVKLTEGESPFVTYEFKGSQNLDCYLKAVEAVKYIERFTVEGNDVGRRLIKEALSLCPENVLAICVFAWTHMFDFRFATTKSPKESLEKAIDLAQKAIALDNRFAWGHASLGYFYLYKREYDKAIAEGERAIILSPSSADMHAMYADTLTISGRPEEAIPLLKKAIRLNPFSPSWYFSDLGEAYRYTGQLDEAVSGFKKAIQHAPENFLAHVKLTAVYSMMEREKEARAEAAEVLRINPKFSLDIAAKMFGYKDQSQTDKIVNALRNAGLK